MHGPVGEEGVVEEDIGTVTPHSITSIFIQYNNYQY